MWQNRTTFYSNNHLLSHCCLLAVAWNKGAVLKNLEFLRWSGLLCWRKSWKLSFIVVVTSYVDLHDWQLTIFTFIYDCEKSYDGIAMKTENTTQDGAKMNMKNLLCLASDSSSRILWCDTTSIKPIPMSYFNENLGRQCCSQWFKFFQVYAVLK